MKTVVNPSRPHSLKPVHEITDRAKRYRANATAGPLPARCWYCGKNPATMWDHLSGDESHGDPRNLVASCRSCNTTKGIEFRNAGIGVLTRQRNPGKRSKGPSYKQYLHMVGVMRGINEGDSAQAREALEALPRDLKVEYTARTWIGRRRKYGPAGRTPSARQLALAEVPF